jgi:hypothetical protein
MAEVERWKRVLVSDRDLQIHRGEPPLELVFALCGLAYVPSEFEIRRDELQRGYWVTFCVESFEAVEGRPLQVLEHVERVD